MPWFTAYTRPSQEYLARNEICLLGFEYFLPVILRKAMKRKKRVLVSEPLFPNYIFVQCGKDNLGSVRRSKSVEYLLENNGLPLTIPTHELEKLQLAERVGAFDFTKPRAKFRIGDEVTIQEGPFAGLIAKVQSASPRKRIKILMKLLGGDVNLDVDSDELVRSGNDPLANPKNLANACST